MEVLCHGVPEQEVAEQGCVRGACGPEGHDLCEEQTLSLNRNEKAAVVADVSAQAARANTLAVAEYRGLTVDHLNKLRVDARAKC